MYLFQPFKRFYSQSKEAAYPFLKKWHAVFLKFIFTYIPLSGIVTILLVLPASQSRPAWLPVGLNTAFVLFIRYQVWKDIRRILNNPLKRLTTGILALILLAARCWGLYYFKKDSADGRILVWKVYDRWSTFYWQWL
jgi:O-antigen polymerase